MSALCKFSLSGECFPCLDFPLRPSTVSAVSLRADDALLESRHTRPASLWGTVPSPEAPRQPVSCCCRCCCWDPCRSGFSSAQRLAHLWIPEWRGGQEQLCKSASPSVGMKNRRRWFRWLEKQRSFETEKEQPVSLGWKTFFNHFLY